MCKVKVYVQHYMCGNYDSDYVSCRHFKGECWECSNHCKSHVEEKEVTKDELKRLIEDCSDWFKISTVKPE